MGVRLRLIVIVFILISYSCREGNVDYISEGPYYCDVYNDSSCKFFFVFGKNGNYIVKYMTAGNCCKDSLHMNKIFESKFIDSFTLLLTGADLNNRKIEIEYGCNQSLEKQLNFIHKIDSTFTNQFGLNIKKLEIERPDIIIITLGNKMSLKPAVSSFTK